MNFGNISEVFFILLATFTLCRCKEPMVTLTTPVVHADEGGIFSIHCQIWNLESDVHAVEIVRTFDGESDNGRGRSERLSADEDVPSKVDDRFFLAVRKLPDGSVVYFMSLINVRRDDEAAYSCKVRSVDPIMEIAGDTVHLDVTYFPAKTEPICSSSVSANGNLEVIEGEDISFDCNTDSGRPEVELTWSRAGSEHVIINAVNEVINDRTHSKMTLTPKMSDQGSIFICQITSTAFPGRKQTCHVGPISVYKSMHSRPGNPGDGAILTSDAVTDRNSIDRIDQKPPTPAVHGPENTAADCRTKCSAFYQDESNVQYWMLGTGAAGFLAVIFLLAVIALAVQYTDHKKHMHGKAPSSSHRHYLQPHQPLEDIYTSLDRNTDTTKMYMMLDQKQNPQLYGLREDP